MLASAFHRSGCSHCNACGTVSVLAGAACCCPALRSSCCRPAANSPEAFSCKLDPPDVCQQVADRRFTSCVFNDRLIQLVVTVQHIHSSHRHTFFPHAHTSSDQAKLIEGRLHCAGPSKHHLCIVCLVLTDTCKIVMDRSVGRVGEGGGGAGAKKEGGQNSSFPW